MRQLVLVAVALGLAACTPQDLGSVNNPSSLANQTTLDEKAATGFELAYATARTAAEALVDVGVIKGENAAKLRTWNQQAYSALGIIRFAYKTGNATGLDQAVSDFRAAIAGINSLAGRKPTSFRLAPSDTALAANDVGFRRLQLKLG